MIVSYLFGTLSLVALLLLIYSVGSSFAFLRGYQQGWKECEEWAVKASAQVDQAREQIWREEPKEGRSM